MPPLPSPVAVAQGSLIEPKATRAAADREEWRWLMHEPGLGIIIGDDAGRVLEANELGSILWFGKPPSEIIGGSLRAVDDDALLLEVVQNFERVHRTGKIGFERTIWGGRQLVVTHYPLDRSGLHRRMLYLTRHVWGAIVPPNAHRVVDINCGSFDFGHLDVLSNRELEVLALIADGLSLAEVATRLNRSIKTIDAHRSAIGRKLCVHSRIGLIRLALTAGLRPEDSSRPRLQVIPHARCDVTSN